MLVGMAEDTYRLIRSADGRAYAVPRLGPQIAVPLASEVGEQPAGPAGRLPAPADRPGRLQLELVRCHHRADGEAAELEPRAGVAAGRPSTTAPS